MKLAGLPLTPNGKVDRRALPVPTQAAFVDVEEYQAPRDEHEQRLAQLWGELLGHAQVGIQSNFFQLGGHSLSLTTLRGRIREAFQAQLSIQSLFAHPTITEQVALIRQYQLQPHHHVALPAMARQARPERLPLSFAQQRLWFLEQLLTGSALYNIPMAFMLTGALDTAALQRSLKVLSQRHESLRTIFIQTGEEVEQVILPELPVGIKRSLLS